MKHIQDTSGERALLHAVILTAVRDACLQPVRTRRGNYRALRRSLDAMDFLMRAQSGMQEYCEWLGLDHNVVRRRLLETMRSDKPDHRFTDTEKRSFRLNYAAWDRAHEIHHEDDEDTVELRPEEVLETALCDASRPLELTSW